MKYKVLLAEDERNLRNIVRTFLTQNDFEVDTANDGEEAIFAINKNVYDIIILDLPPVTVVPDASIVATKVDKTVLVARVKVTPREELEKTKKMLENVNAKIAGVVLNGVKTSAKKYYGNYYK